MTDKYGMKHRQLIVLLCVLTACSDTPDKGEPRDGAESDGQDSQGADDAGAYTEATLPLPVDGARLTDLAFSVACDAPTIVDGQAVSQCHLVKADDGKRIVSKAPEIAIAWGSSTPAIPPDVAEDGLSARVATALLGAALKIVVNVKGSRNAESVERTAVAMDFGAVIVRPSGYVALVERRSRPGLLTHAAASAACTSSGLRLWTAQEAQEALRTGVASRDGGTFAWTDVTADLDSSNERATKVRSEAVTRRQIPDHHFDGLRTAEPLPPSQDGVLRGSDGMPLPRLAKVDLEGFQQAAVVGALYPPLTPAAGAGYFPMPMGRTTAAILQTTSAANPVGLLIRGRGPRAGESVGADWPTITELLFAPQSEPLGTAGCALTGTGSLASFAVSDVADGPVRFELGFRDPAAVIRGYRSVAPDEGCDASGTALPRRADKALDVVLDRCAPAAEANVAKVISAGESSEVTLDVCVDIDTAHGKTYVRAARLAYVIRPEHVVRCRSAEGIVVATASAAANDEVEVTLAVYQSEIEASLLGHAPGAMGCATPTLLQPFRPTVTEDPAPPLLLRAEGSPAGARSVGSRRLSRADWERDGLAVCEGGVKVATVGPTGLVALFGRPP